MAVYFNNTFHNMKEGTDETWVYMKKDSRSTGRHSGPPNIKHMLNHDSQWFTGLTEIIKCFQRFTKYTGLYNTKVNCNLF